MPPPLVFFDLETRSKQDIRDGLWKYASHESTHIVLASFLFRTPNEHDNYGVGCAPGYDLGLPHDWDELVGQWNAHIERGGLVVAWNAQFDRVVLEHCGAQCGMLTPKIEQTLCAQALAESYALPGGLGKAATTLRVQTQKLATGKALMRTFADGNQPWPEPTEGAQKAFRHYMAYAMADTLAMAEVWDRCRPWAAQEWQDYHVVERMNQHGMLFDVQLAEKAIIWADNETRSLNAELQRMTDDPYMMLSKSKRKLDWVQKRLAGTALEELLWVSKTKMITDENGNKRRITAKNRSLGAGVQNALRDALLSGEYPDVDTGPLLEFLDILERGNGVAAKKFLKIHNTHVDGRLRHQYRCGPTQTGRHASRGVQFDNIVRDKLPGKDAAIITSDIIVGMEELSHLTPNQIQSLLEQWFQLPLNKIMARLIRPGIIAPEGKWLVWGDWSSIEARVLPWLAKSERALKPYREGQCVYSMAAAAIYGGAWGDIFEAYKAGDAEGKYRRLVGKVATLSLGFEGGAGALREMARAFGVVLEHAEAESIKTRWREARPWATRLWRELNEASFEAMRNPGYDFHAGRLKLRRIGRDLYMFLPDGRPLVYPEAEITVQYKEDWDKDVEVITYRKKYGGGVLRGELYGGILAENGTQGTANSLLRFAMRAADRQPELQLIGTTHDEIRAETRLPEDEATHMLSSIMTTVPEWAEGLPIEAEVEYGPYYGK